MSALERRFLDDSHAGMRRGSGGSSPRVRDRKLQPSGPVMTRSTRPADDLRHAIDALLRETPDVAHHRWIAQAPDAAERPWSALEIRLRGTCDAPCAHEIERRLLSVPGVRGLGPHWPRPEHEGGTLLLRLYVAHPLLPLDPGR
jgi:hypothetical protein